MPNVAVTETVCLNGVSVLLGLLYRNLSEDVKMAIEEMVGQYAVDINIALIHHSVSYLF